MSRLVMVAGLAAAVLALGACASQSSNSVAANQKAAAKKQHLICTTQASLDSHIPQTTCMTEQQYKEMQKEGAKQRDKMQQMQQNNVQSCSDTGTCSGSGGPPRR